MSIEINNNKKLSQQMAEIAAQVDALEEIPSDLQTQVNNLVLQAGNPSASSAEIVQARSIESTLHARLEKIESGDRVLETENMYEAYSGSHVVTANGVAGVKYTFPSTYYAPITQNTKIKMQLSIDFNGKAIQIMGKGKKADNSEATVYIVFLASGGNTNSGFVVDSQTLECTYTPYTWASALGYVSLKIDRVYFDATTPVGTYTISNVRWYNSEYENLNNIIKTYKTFKTDTEISIASLISCKMSNPLYGKSFLFFGDSIMYGAGTTVPGIGAWRNLLKTNNPSVTVYHHSYGGARIARDSVQGTTGVIQAIISATEVTDYIIIQGGVNDTWDAVNIPLGSISTGYSATLDEYTFCGALESCFKTALTKWAGKKIGFVTTYKIADAPLLDSYMEQARLICRKWQIPFLDFNYESAGINLHLAAHKTAYTGSADGTHYNDLAYQITQPKFERWLMSL